MCCGAIGEMIVTVREWLTGFVLRKKSNWHMYKSAVQIMSVQHTGLAGPLRENRLLRKSDTRVVVS